MPQDQQFTNVQPIQQTFTSVTPVGGSAQTQPDTETGVWAGVKRNTVGMVTGLYHAFSDPATDQEKQDILSKIKKQNATGDDIPESLATDPSRATLAYHRLIDAPADQLEAKGGNERAAAKDLLSHGQILKGANTYLSGVADSALSAVPLAGPAINSIAERFEKGDHSGAATDLAFALTAQRMAKSTAGEAAEATPASKLSEQIAHSRAMDAGGEATPTPAEAPTGTLATLLRNSAQKSYEEVLNPTKQTTKFQTQKIMPQMLDERPVALTRQGLADKAAANAEQAGQAIEQKVPTLQGSMQTQPVIQGLQNLKKSFQVNGVSLRPEVDSAIDSVSGQLKAMGSDISFQDAVRARRILDSAVNEAKGFTGAQLSDASMASIRKETANSIRSEISSEHPDLAALNAKFHFWNTLSDVMDATIQRKTGQAPLLREMIGNAAAGGAGLAAGGPVGAAAYGSAMYTLGKAFRSTGWKTASAATKLSIADALSSGNFKAVNELVGKAGLGGLAVSQQPALDSAVGQ